MRSDDTTRVRDFAHWVNRVFGSWGAYSASLPARRWVQRGGGWYSTVR